MWSWCRLVVVSLALSWAGSATAHGGSRSIEVDGLPQVVGQPPSGVSLRVVETNALQFALATNGCCVVEVLDDQGKAFIQIDSTGSKANLARPAWHQAKIPGGAPIPEEVQAGMPDTWRMLSDHPGYGWYDQRLNVGGPKEFELRLRINGEMHSVLIERKLPKLDGMWRASITQQPKWPGYMAVLSGAQGEVLVLGLLGNQGPLWLLDDEKNEALRFDAKGVWAKVEHPWVSGLKPKEGALAIGGWVQLSDSARLAFPNPYYVAEAPAPSVSNNATVTRNFWLKFGDQLSPLTLQQRWVTFTQ